MYTIYYLTLVENYLSIPKDGLLGHTFCLKIKRQQTQVYNVIMHYTNIINNENKNNMLKIDNEYFLLNSRTETILQNDPQPTQRLNRLKVKIYNKT